jgi:hypothetical protein
MFHFAYKPAQISQKVALRLSTIIDAIRNVAAMASSNIQYQTAAIILALLSSRRPWHATVSQLPNSYLVANLEA